MSIALAATALVACGQDCTPKKICVRSHKETRTRTVEVCIRSHQEQQYHGK